MPARGFGPAVLLLLLAAASKAAEFEDWSDAPAQWIAGLNLSAFCVDRTSTFDSQGEFVTIGEGRNAPPGRMTAEDAFFLGYYEGPVHWSADGPVRDELTTFEVRRAAGTGLAMAGFVRDALAVSRQFETVTISGIAWTRKADAASCEDGKPALIEVHHYADGIYGKTHVRRARLAIAGDEALIVKFEDYSCRICLFRSRKRTYARFPAAQAPEL
jgi:hypothetical protein